MQVARKKYQVASIKYQEDCTKNQVLSTKYGIRVIGCFLLLLYQVRSTKY